MIEKPIGHHLLKKLEIAARNQNQEEIRKQFTAGAVLSFPDEMAFAGRDSIASLYLHLQQNLKMKTIGYAADRTEDPDENR